jgi:adenylate kinase family enzyme
MKKPIVVNLTGAPGAGKSTGAATIFAELKKAGINAELVTEYAKDKTWEHNATALGCQEYIFGKQSYRLARCRDGVDVIVTDSPLPLGLIYNTNPALDYHFTCVVMNVFNTYDNINFFINRVKPYNPKGRNQTEEESDQLSVLIKNLYKNNNISFIEINGDTEGYTKAVQEVLDYIKFIKEENTVNE